jgi:uncharacterized membrane protein YbhN (UPF0104 family)
MTDDPSAETDLVTDEASNRLGDDPTQSVRDRVGERVRQADVWTSVWRFLLAGMVVTLVLSIYADAGDLLRTLHRFDWRLLVAAVGLTLGNQALRFVKWEYLLRELDIHIPLRTSVQIFGSALIMIISPGKVGDFWKAWLLRDEKEIRIDRSSPVVVVERLTDLLAVGVLSLLGVVVFGRSPTALFVLLGLVIVGVIVLRHRPTCLWLLGMLNYLPFGGRLVGPLRQLYENSYELLTVRVLFVTGVMSLCSWALECVGMWIILQGFGANVSVLAAAFVFAFSSIVGALSMLPGGVGATEGTMTALLLRLGIGRGTAVGATLLVRAATLWFVAIAAVGIYGYYRLDANTPVVDDD